MYILPITPTLARWEAWPEVKKANKLLREMAESRAYATYIDGKGGFLNQDGGPIWKYYKWDGTHLNREGYRIWSEWLKRYLT